MFSSVRNLWGGRRARPQANRLRKACLQVEALEERAVPTIAFTPNFGRLFNAGPSRQVQLGLKLTF